MGDIINAYLILVGKPPEKYMCKMKYTVTFTFLFRETCYEQYYFFGCDSSVGSSAQLYTSFLLVSYLVYSATLKIKAYIPPKIL
jgi:hypothetical protein